MKKKSPPSVKRAKKNEPGNRWSILDYPFELVCTSSFHANNTSASHLPALPVLSVLEWKVTIRSLYSVPDGRIYVIIGAARDDALSMSVVSKFPSARLVYGDRIDYPLAYAINHGLAPELAANLARSNSGASGFPSWFMGYPSHH